MFQRAPSGGRRVLARLALGLLVTVLVAGPVFAQAVAVPAELQAELLARLVAYDRNFTTRAGQTAQIVLLTRPGDARSAISAAAMKFALSRVENLAGLPHRETIAPLETGAALARRIRADRVAAVYLTPGLDDSLRELKSALSGVDVLTVAAVPEYVPQGAVLGFEVVSGKPKIALNLEQAKLQNVSFKADVLKLMKVYR